MAQIGEMLGDYRSALDDTAFSPTRREWFDQLTSKAVLLGTRHTANASPNSCPIQGSACIKSSISSPGKALGMAYHFLTEICSSRANRASSGLAGCIHKVCLVSFCFRLDRPRQFALEEDTGLTICRLWLALPCVMQHERIGHLLAQFLV